jgi:hypothetical protein
VRASAAGRFKHIGLKTSLIRDNVGVERPIGAVNAWDGSGARAGTPMRCRDIAAYGAL